jgi:hypothetical protein
MGEEINTEKTADKVRGKPFQKGDDPRRNLEGRPSGALNFATKFRAFVEKVAENNEMTPEEIEEQLLAVGYKNAKAGNYNFWKDIHDRVYGKPEGSLDIKSGGEKIQTNFIVFGDFNETDSEQDL